MAFSHEGRRRISRLVEKYFFPTGRNIMSTEPTTVFNVRPTDFVLILPLEKFM